MVQNGRDFKMVQLHFKIIQQGSVKIELYYTILNGFAQIE